MSPIEHIILYSILFVFFYIWGKYNYNAQDEHVFWPMAILPIFLYSFIVGSRYGWGPDYFGYKYRMENAFTYYEEQVGFRWLNQIINLIGFNYVVGYIIYSLIFMFGAFILIRSYHKESKYMYAFLVPAILIFVNSAIRQGVALSFLLVAIYFMNKRKWLAVAIFILIGSSIHSVTLLPAIILLCFLLFIKQPLDWRITIPLYLFFTFIFDGSKIGFLADYLQYISLDNKFQGYIDKSDLWFSSDAANDIYEQGTFALIMSSGFYISIIFLGYQALKTKMNQQILFIYNSFVFSVILFRAVFLYEILRRIAEPIILLYFILIGYILYIYDFNKVLVASNIESPDKRKDVIYRLGIVVILIYILLFVVRFIFMRPQSRFFWNI